MDFVLKTKTERYFRRGFTLIELLVGLAIVAVMSSALFLVFNPLEQVKKARDARKKNDLSQIQKALEAYYQDFGRYPASDLNYKIKGGSGGSVVEWGSPWPPYMGILPKDSSFEKTFVYVADSSNGQSYSLYANLDRGVNDLDSCRQGKCPRAPDDKFCGNSSSYICNYGVSSSNISP